MVTRVAGTKRPCEAGPLQWPPLKMQCISPPSSPTRCPPQARLHPSLPSKPALLPTPPDSVSGLEETQKDKQDSVFPVLLRADPAKSLLLNQIQFVPASRLTYEDQMAVLRGQRAQANISNEHNRRRRQVLDLPNHSIRRRDHDKTTERKEDEAHKVSKPQHKRLPVGFRNPGNWCYRRAVNQCLMNIPRFGAYLQNHEQSWPDKHVGCRVACSALQGKEQTKPAEEKECSSKAMAENMANPCLLCAFAALFRACEAHDQRATDAPVTQVDNALTAIGTPPLFRNNRQEDAHDYLLPLIERFLTFHNHTSPVVEGLFKLQSRTEWRCQNCTAVSSTACIDETGLQLYPQQDDNTVSLDTLLRRAFTSQADIKCDTCKHSDTRTRTMKITAAPEALVIQLARFGHNEDTPTKVMTRVDFPDVLDLSQYLDEVLLRGPRNLTYQLSSVVHHKGTLKGGHYVATIGIPGSDSRERTVWEMDDSRVSRSANNQHKVQPFPGFTPYILTYINRETRSLEVQGPLNRDVAKNLVRSSNTRKFGGKL